ncbi:MAG: hypothetical protein RLZZ370_189 [Bacteroidota bacterium]|jgi:POT family proton-dependent oligopeptide transporter
MKNNNTKILLSFVVALLVSILLFNQVLGMSFDVPAQQFQIYLYSVVIAFLTAIMVWIFGQKEHPAGLRLLFFTEMWERFSYYGMRGLLILYLTKTYAEGGLGFDDNTAGLIYGIYTGLVYLTPIIGGWLADNYIGQRRSITIGGILMALGQFALATNAGMGSFYAGLAMLIVGNGFFKPNISIVVGQLYDNQDPRKDRAFNIFYMGINLGAFLAPLVCGFLAEDFFATKEAQADGSMKVTQYAFQYGFLAAGIGMALGQLMFNTLGQKYLGDIGKRPANKNLAAGDIVDNMSASGSGLTKEEKDRTRVIVILVAFVTFFWAGFEQAGGALSLYTDKYIDREVSDFLIPTSWFQSVNPLFIVMLAPLFTILWSGLNRSNKEPNTPVKMGLGMILLGLGFLLMVGAVLQRGGEVADSGIKASIYWMLGTYLIHTCGELCLSPIGLSMVTKLAPVKLASLLMGVWFLSSFVANNLAGLTVGFVEKLGAMTIFGGIAGFTIFMGLVLIALNKKLLAMMHGVK